MNLLPVKVEKASKKAFILTQCKCSFKNHISYTISFLFDLQLCVCRSICMKMKYEYTNVLIYSGLIYIQQIQ